MPAIVEPVAAWIGNTVASWFAAAGASAATVTTVSTLTTAVSQIALYAGMQYAVDAVSRPKIKPPGSELSFNIDPAYPREMIIGQRLVGGSMVARYSRGSNLYNAHMVIQVADHPCVELSKVYDNGRVVQDSPLVHGVRTEITAYSNSGGPRVWMTWHDGRAGQTADADLITKSAQDPEVVNGTLPAWSSDHRGAGCAYIHAEVQWDSDILTSMPQFTWLVKGAPLYDRRKDSTAGGSGSHRLGSPSTWEYSTNARVALDHYLLGYKVEDEDIAFGIGLAPEDVPYAEFEACADLCDEDVETGTGLTVETIKRYAANGVISAADYYEDVVEAMQLQMAARVVDLGGSIGIVGAEERSVVVSLTDGDLVRGEPIQFAPNLPFSDLYGSVAGTFSDPGNLYQPTPYDTQYTAFRALPDGGEAQAVTLPLPYEVHPRRAVRLASAWLSRESLQPRLIAVFSPKAWKLRPGDWFDFTSAPLQLDAEKFEVVDIVHNEDFTVVITARAIDPDFLAFDNDNDPDLSIPPDVPPVPLFLDAPEFDVAVTTLEAGGVVEPALEVTLTSDETVAREIVYEYAVWDGLADPGEEVVGPTLVDSAHVSQIVTKLRKGILPDTVYSVRAKAKAGSRESPWTEWCTPVLTGSTYAVGSASSVPWSGVTGSGKPADNATKNTLTFASSAPSSPTNGDIWVDTTSAPYLIKARVSGAWQISGSYGGVFGGSLYETTGGAVASLANFKTISGTAAAIVGQAPAATDSTIQAGATKNTLTFAGTAPSSPTNGDLWVDTSTTPYVIKSRVSGAWQASGSYGGVFGSTLYETGGGAVASLAAFKTISGTAAAITGQSLLATASQVPASYIAPADPSNMVLDPAFLDTAYWLLSSADSTYSTATEITTTLGAAKGVKHHANGNVSQTDSWMRTPTGSASNMLVEPGRSYALSLSQVKKSGTKGQGAAAVVWWDRTGTIISASFVTGAAGTAGADTTEHLLGLVTAPAGAYTANFYGYVTWTAGVASAGDFYQTRPRMRRALQLGSTLVAEDGTTLLTNGTVITINGTAAAIVGQGWGATASEAAARATRGQGLLKNPRFEEPFSGSGIPPQWSDYFAGSGTYATKVIGDGGCFSLVGAAGSNNAIYQDLAAVNPSTDYLLVAELRRTGGSLDAAAVAIEIYNSSNVLVGSSYIQLGTDSTTAGGISTTPDGVIRWEKLVTTSGTAAKARIVLYSHSGLYGSNAVANSIHWYEVDLIPMSLVRQLRADVTGSNTSGAITGQGGLATKNMYYQGTDPGGSNGELWGDTAANKLKYKNSGSWVIVADISPAPQLSLAASGNFLKIKSGAGSSLNTSNSVTFTPSGGTPSGTSYSYTAELAGNTNPAIAVSLSASSGSGATFAITVSATSSPTSETRGTVIVTVTDSAGKTAQFSKPYLLSWEP